MKKILLLSLCALLACTLQTCHRAAPSQDRARITVNRVDVKKTRATLSTVVDQLHRGDEVDILGREPRWLYVRTPGGQRGWIEESAAMDQSIIDAENKVVAETQNEIVQAAGNLSAMTNLHVAPGRETPVFTRLPKGSQFQIFDRSLTTRPSQAAKSGSETTAPETPAPKDAWLKIRTTDGLGGWVYSPSVDFDVPDEIDQYSESKRIVAWLVLNQVEAEDGRKVNQYVVADVVSGIMPEYDFDRIRVFTWNRKRNRYETAFRENKILGLYPLRVFRFENKPAFEFTRLADSRPDSARIPERFFMNGVIVRKIEADKTVPIGHSKPRR